MTHHAFSRLSSWRQRARLLGAIGALASGCSSDTSDPAQHAGALESCQTVLTTSSGGSITDAGANVWTLTASGEVDENGTAVAGGSGTSELTYDSATETIYGQDASSGTWYAWRAGTWNGPSSNPIGSNVCGDCSCQIVLTTTSGGSIMDDSGNVWTLLASGQIDENGSAVAGGGGTSGLTFAAASIWGRDAASGNWYAWTGAMWDGPGASPVGTNVCSQAQADTCGGGSGSGSGSGSDGGGGTGQFHIANGQIIDPDGHPFIAKGIDLGGDQVGVVSTNSAGAPLTSMFHGINFVRLADGSRPDPSSYTTFIQQVTAHGVVVEIEDHPWPLAHPYTGGALASETAWYASLAQTFKTNPYVWFGSMNEPQSDYGSAESAISDQEVAIYNAIRGTGNNTIIMMSLLGGGNPGTIGDGYGMTTSAYATMTKIVWDLHHYGWMTGYSQDLNTEKAALIGSPQTGSGISAAQTIRSADGLVPVIIGEYGNSTTGDQIDPNGNVVVQAVQQSGYGCVAWAWHAADTIGDMLVDGNGNLTAYGQEVASFIGM
jgi:hypothetical protein